MVSFTSPRALAGDLDGAPEAIDRLGAEVAELQAALQALVEDKLRDGGHEVIQAFDGMQAVMFASRAPIPGAVVLDINMPGGTGLDALRRIKASARTAHVVVVVLSATLDPAMESQVLAAGAAAFMKKPVDPGHLCEALGVPAL